METYSRINNFDIRLVRYEDLLQLQELYKQLSDNRLRQSFNTISDVLTRANLSALFSCWIILDKDKIIATISLWILPSLLHGGSVFGQIENLVVDEQYRMFGLGSALVGIATRHAKNASCYKVQLNCEQTNIEFYRKCGFHEHEVCMRVDI